MDEWISVKDRLPIGPEQFEDYLIFDEYGVGCGNYSRAINQDGCIWVRYGTGETTVTYWMPLPEPPKENK
jgi:hypothetical protein